MRQAAATAAVPNLQSSSACCSRAHSRSKNETAAAEVRGCSWNDSQVCTAREFARVGGALGAGERGREGKERAGHRGLRERREVRNRPPLLVSVRRFLDF